MDCHTRRETVAGIFKDEEAATRAVKKLVEEHFNPEEDVSVITSHRHEREGVPVAPAFDVGRTSLIGAAVGAVVTGIGVALVGITVGPFTLEAAGPLRAAVEWAYAGGTTGVALGALLSMDFAGAGANFRRAHIHGGVIWVGVEAAGARADRARQILAESGATHFMDKRPEVATG